MAARGHGTGDLPGSCALHGSWVDGSRRARAAAEHWPAGLAACYPDVLPPRGIGGLARQRGSDEAMTSPALVAFMAAESSVPEGLMAAGSPVPEGHARHSPEASPRAGLPHFLQQAC